MNSLFKYFLIPLCLVSCYRIPDRIDPQISYPIQDQHFNKLSSAFSPLSEEEKNTAWGKECIIARSFAEELDLYRAVSTFKRAKFLVENQNRKLEIEYDILLCFFLAKRYVEVVESFEKSDLSHVDKEFAAYEDLLLILYEAYREIDTPERQQKVLDLIQKTFPQTNEELKFSTAIRKGDLAMIDEFACGFNQDDSYLDNLLCFYSTNKKSVPLAQGLNAIIPGAGYLYIGQKKSALTAFLLNGLFITAAVQFFLHKHIAAGIITTGFEAGWYFGGIYGAGEEAKYYNERLYEHAASVVLNEYKLFPTLMLNHAF